GGRWGGEGTDGVRVLRGEVASAALDVAMGRARALASVTLIEREPPGNAGGGWMSSSDFHKALDFTAGATPFALEHTGYDSSSDQLDYLALELEVDAIDAAIPAKSLSDTPVDAAGKERPVDEVAADYLFKPPKP